MATRRNSEEPGGLPPTLIDDAPSKRKTRKRSRTRGHRGAGSVYQRADGLWVAQIRYQGRVRRAYARDWSAADEKLRHLRATVGRTQTTEAQTVAEFAEAWLYYEEHQDSRRRTLRPVTITGYRQLLRDYVLPAIGHRDIRGPWSKSDLGFLRDRNLPSDGRRPPTRKTLHNVRAVTRRLFNLAVTWELIEASPLKSGDWPSGYRARSGGQTLTSKQAAQLIETAWRVNPTVAPILSLLLYTAARVGEVLALRWGRVDLQPPASLEIRETLTKGIDGRVTFGAPKTERARRRIYLNDEAAEVIAQLPSHVGAAPQSLLFPSPYTRRDASGDELPGGWQMPMSQSHVYHVLQDCLAEAGLPKVRVHDLRHTAISLMLASGIEVVTVAEIAGHASSSITHDMYSHVVPGRQREAVKVLSFRPSSTENER